MRNDLNYFVERELYPDLFNCIDTAFPEMQFTKRGNNWYSHYDKELVYHDRYDETQVWRNAPFCLKSWSGSNINLINLRIQLNGGRLGDSSAYFEAVEYLAKCCRLEVPAGDPEAIKRYQERQKKRDERETILAEAKKALFSPEGKEDLEYMKSRGWTEEEIKDADLGYLSPALREKCKSLGIAIPENKKSEITGKWMNYTLLIPYRSNGHLEGFKGRDIHADEADKKYKYTNNKELPVKESPFGMPGYKLRPKDDEYNITIVEGELDALHAQVRGIKNIVATTNKLEISQAFLDMAKEKGFRMVTILVDHEDHEDLDKEDKIEKAVKQINAQGLTPLVAFLPGEAGVKVDTDSYLRDNEGKEDLEKIIKKAGNAFEYLYTIRERKLYDKIGGGTELSSRDYENFKKETFAFIADNDLNLEARDLVIKRYSKIFNGTLTPEAVEQGVNEYLAEKAKKRKTEETEKLLAEAKSRIELGDTQGAIQHLKEKLEKVESISDRDELQRILKGKSSSDRKVSLRAGVEGIETGYAFPDNNKGFEPMTLPSGAITLIGGLPSHGKSAFLRNLALQVVQKKDRKGSVLYFTYEEDGDSTYLRFLNLLYGKWLNAGNNNIRTLRSYYREGKNYIPNPALQDFKETEKLLDSWTDSHRLVIIDEDLTAGKLRRAIEMACTDTSLYPEGISAVFIDYAQLIYKENNKLQRNEELKMITKDLREVAKKFKLPIVLACQLKREMKDPYSWGIQDIADSADLEREANLIALIWNTSFEVTAGLKDTDKLGKLIEQIKEKFRKGFEFKDKTKEYSYLLVELGKNREGIRGVTQKFRFYGNTGRVEPGEEETEDIIYK